MNWPRTLASLLADGEPFVSVTVAATRGSTPRETGAKMFVTGDKTIGTIGGGQLEHESTAIAVRRLATPAGPAAFFRRFTLGADCGQCCGGVAEILFERVVPGEGDWPRRVAEIAGAGRAAVLVTVGDGRTGVDKRIVASGETVDPADEIANQALALIAQQAPAQRGSVRDAAGNSVPVLYEPLQDERFAVAVFGAGHVGSAVVGALAPLAGRICWADGRDGIFPDGLPDNVVTLPSVDARRVAKACGAGGHYLVMTHSHALDLEICAALLARDDVASCGLIGSLSKRRRFEKRLAKTGLDAARIARLTCPIGIDGIPGKRPAEIAVAVAAQLLQRRAARRGQAAASPPFAVRQRAAR